MHRAIVEQVVEFCGSLFGHVFSKRFAAGIADPLRRNAVVRQVEESADAASQSLTRFFLNEQLSEAQVVAILGGLAALCDRLSLNDIANPNVTPEKVAEHLLTDLPCPEGLRAQGLEAVYRVTLHSLVQVLMLVGPVMAEWQKLGFSSTFELPRRVVNRLNQISEQMDVLGRSGQAAADERYELSYRDYLLQRFHRAEAGTVRMTTNLDVDLRELFVMPRLLARPVPKKGDGGGSAGLATLMDLETARRAFGLSEERSAKDKPAEGEDQGVPALEQAKTCARVVIVGVPGSGKSTFLEWLQLKLAAAEEELVMAGEQAIPLLLRVRELHPRDLPRGAALVERTTASKDRAALMPAGWIDRQMKAGRVLFMLDGLDETEPELRDQCVLPWLLGLCRDYPGCRFLVSSRPVGYPPGTLSKSEFTELDLADFQDSEISEYTRHWCTAVRLARNEPEAEARREGAADGERIVGGFKGHPYIHNLARNPLMLSAICLVNYFERGQLPKDRAVLYKLCVEGLLHHWDQRRGIHSEFGFDEKLRACREVALAMQADDRAEYEADKVQRIFAMVLDNPARAEKLLEHIRRRTGLLLERRPGAFAFAHLTFQEYLAARAVYEGNRLSIDASRIVHEHADERWREVIALYCGLAPAPVARQMIERLIAQPDSDSLSIVLAECYFSVARELSHERQLRRRVLKRVARAPVYGGDPTLERFSSDEVAPIANLYVGQTQGESRNSEAWYWLLEHPQFLDGVCVARRLRGWRRLRPSQTGELIHLLHARAPDALLAEIAGDADLYAGPGPEDLAGSQAESALAGLSLRPGVLLASTGVEAAWLRILRTFAYVENCDLGLLFRVVVGRFVVERLSSGRLPPTVATWPEFAASARRLAKRLETPKDDWGGAESASRGLNSWADLLERAIAERAIQEPKPESAPRSGAKGRTRNRPKRGDKK
jgi:hypothetical protein